MEYSYIANIFNQNDGFFTENYGQEENNEVRFYIQNKGIWFLNNAVVFQIFNEQKEKRDPNSILNSPHSHFKNTIIKSEPQKGVVIQLTFENSNNIIPMGRGLLNHKSNYFYGNETSKWLTNVPNFQEIIYKNLYDNIDLKYYNTFKGLKYDFIVHPGGELSDIKLKYEGIEDMETDPYGNLKIITNIGEIIDSNLFVYQNYDFGKKEIIGKFKLITQNTYGFELLEKVDFNKDLIIDPLIYSSFFGGSGEDMGWSIETDINDNIYGTGMTGSMDFPNTTGVVNNSQSGNGDSYVFKMDLTGSKLLYSTYIGGSEYDSGSALMVDNNGSAYVIGSTYSNDFPITNGSFDSSFGGVSDIYVLKLNKNGSKLIYSTYIGGKGLDGCGGIAVDSMGQAYITGNTSSPGFPATLNAFNKTYVGDDAFVLKLNSNGSALIYSTFIPGNGRDYGIDIVIDSTGNAYVTGFTTSANFPTTYGAFDNSFNSVIDVFVLKLNQNGSTIIYSTFIGGSNSDLGSGILIDDFGNAFVTGFTESSDFPNSTNAYDNSLNGYRDVFILKLNQTGSSLNFSTYIGGISRDEPSGIAIDNKSNIYLTGLTTSSDFPNSSWAYDTTYNGQYDGFILKLNHSGSSLDYSTYVGGKYSEYGTDLALDSKENIWITGWTWSSNFPTTPNAFDRTHNGGLWDVYIFKFNINQSVPPFVLDLDISDPKVLRTNSIYLYSNASDNENLEIELTPYFEYRDQNELSWNNTWFLKPIYKNFRWEVRFTPPKNATLGIYDFRVRFRNKEFYNSSWFYLRESLSVLNNIPLIKNLLLSTNKARLGDSVTIWINGTDVEDPEFNLTVELLYRDPNDHVWNVSYLNTPIYANDKWKFTLFVPFDALFGFYDFRVRLNDTDQNSSKWLFLNDSLLILNINPEVIDIKLSKSSIYRTNSVFLYINGTDYETPESMLKLYVQYKHNNEKKWIDLSGIYSNLYCCWKIEIITTKITTLGLYDFRVKFIDNVNASSEWKYLNQSLMVLNNIPLVFDINFTKDNIFRTKSTYININCSDIENDENLLNCKVQYKSPTGNWISLNNITYKNDHWEFIYNSTNNTELGYYDLRVNITDLDNDYSGWKIIQDAFEIKNNRPMILESCDNFVVKRNTVDIDLTEFESDIEDANLDLIWSIDQSSVDSTLFSIKIIDYLEDTLQIIPKENVSGYNDVTLLLTDKDKDNDIKSDVTIYINSIINISTNEKINDNITINDTNELPSKNESKNDPKISYRVNVSVTPNVVEIKQGESKVVFLIIVNEGNFSNDYYIYFTSKHFTIKNILIEKNLVTLSPGKMDKILIKISIDDNFLVGTYKIEFTGESDKSSDDTDLIVNVKVKDVKPEKNKNKKINYIDVWIFIILIIIIIISLIFLLIKKRQPKHDEVKKDSVPPKKSNIQSQISQYSQSQTDILSKPQQQTFQQNIQSNKNQNQYTNEIKKLN